MADLANPPPGYELGWQHGFETARLEARGELAPGPATSTQKLLAAGTLVAGLGSAFVLVASANPRLAPYRNGLGVIAVAGIILSSAIGAVSVLNGRPTPNLGL